MRGIRRSAVPTAILTATLMLGAAACEGEGGEAELEDVGGEGELEVEE